jgi:hypothetical protein
MYSSPAQLSMASPMSPAASSLRSSGSGSVSGGAVGAGVGAAVGSGVVTAVGTGLGAAVATGLGATVGAVLGAAPVVGTALVATWPQLGSSGNNSHSWSAATSSSEAPLVPGARLNSEPSSTFTRMKLLTWDSLAMTTFRSGREPGPPGAHVAAGRGERLRLHQRVAAPALRPRHSVVVHHHGRTRLKHGVDGGDVALAPPVVVTLVSRVRVTGVRERR